MPPPPSPSSSPLAFEDTILFIFNDVFFFLLGGSAWILINGIYAQIPFIIPFFGGDYGVVSKITLCVTLSSLLPIIGSISLSVFSNHVALRRDNGSNEIKINDNENDIKAATVFDNHKGSVQAEITIILLLGLMASLSLTIWAEWVTSHLVPLLIVTTAGGIVGTSSSILYYPHAAAVADSNGSPNTLKRQATAMMFGSSTSNLLVALLAIFQQGTEQGQHERGGLTITMNVYFGMIAALFGLAAAGFFGTLVIRRIADSASIHKSHVDPEECSLLVEARSIHDNTNNILVHRQSSHYANKEPLSFWGVSRLHSTLNSSQFILNMLTFFLPGIVPYSVRDATKDEAYNASALRCLIVSQLFAQTLGVLASSFKGGISGCDQCCYHFRSTRNNHKDYRIKCQLWCFFLILWVPLVHLSLQNKMEYGIGLPICINTALNFAYGYCNTSWFHLLAHLNNGCSVSTTSAARVMGTWHQIGATLGSAIAFILIQIRDF